MQISSSPLSPPAKASNNYPRKKYAEQDSAFTRNINFILYHICSTTTKVKAIILCGESYREYIGVIFMSQASPFEDLYLHIVLPSRDLIIKHYDMIKV